VVAKNLPNDSFYTISRYCSGQQFFACDYPKTGIVQAITSKKYFEMFIRGTFSMNNMVKTVRAQQSTRGCKFG